MDKILNRLILFTSYHFAAKAEKYLLAHDMKIKLMATPPQLTRFCGLCISLSEEDLERAKKLLVEDKITYTSIYTYEGIHKSCEKIS